MNVTELRIGNLTNKGIVNTIGYKEGILGCVIIKNKFMSFGKWYSYTDLKPVKLTKELLVEYGFGHWEDINEYYSPDKGSALRINHFTKGNTIGFFETLYGIKLTYVHQLQNLYFVIENKELL